MLCIIIPVKNYLAVLLACTLTSSLGHHNWTSESSVYFLFNICLSNQNVLLQYQFICFNFLLKYQEVIKIWGSPFLWILWVTLSMKFIHLNYQIWCLFIIIIKSKSKKTTSLQAHKKSYNTHEKTNILTPKNMNDKTVSAWTLFWKLLFLSIYLIIVAWLCFIEF